MNIYVEFSVAINRITILLDFFLREKRKYERKALTAEGCSC
jgi:hypothetical protein